MRYNPHYVNLGQISQVCEGRGVVDHGPKNKG